MSERPVESTPGEGLLSGRSRVRIAPGPPHHHIDAWVEEFCKYLEGDGLTTDIVVMHGVLFEGFLKELRKIDPPPDPKTAGSCHVPATGEGQ